MITKHYDAIDGLRAFSTIGIVIMHILLNGNYEVGGVIFSKIILSFNNLIFLFIIISGFAMCCGYYDKIINNEIYIGEFYGKRFIKTWPFFALLCLIDFAISPSVNSLYEVFANLTLCFGLLPNANISVIGVGWFIGLVFVFYLIFPFFCYLISNKIRAWVSFFAALAFNLFCSEYFHISRTNIMYSAVFFLLGGLIFIYRGKLQIIADKFRWLILAGCAACTVLYYFVDLSVPIMLVLFSLLLIYAIGSKKRLILSNRATKFLSSISMEIYLCHMLIFRIIEKLKLTHLFGEGVLSYILTCVGTLAGAVLFSLVAQRVLNVLIEKIREISNRKREWSIINVKREKT